MPKHKKFPRWAYTLLSAIIVVGWVAFAGISGPYFGKISDVSSTDLSTFLPNSAEATKVNDQLTKFSDKKAIPVIVVYTHDDKKLTSDDLSRISSVDESLAQVKGVTGTVSQPIQSDDKKAAFVSVPLASDADFNSAFPAIKQKLADSNLKFSYVLTGPASLAHDLQTAFSGIDSTLLLVALGVVFFILLIVYRSPFLPIIVLFTAMSALSVAVFSVYHLADAGVVQLNGQVQGILFILVIGAATDYSLLYISRYREELTLHRKTWDAMWAALKSAYEPIIAAGGTVTAGLLCLLLSDLKSNQALGPVGSIGVAFSVVATLTLLPALLLLAGRTAFWPRRPKFVEKQGRDGYLRNHPAWARVGALVRRHPRRVWAACIVVLLVAVAGVPQLKADGVSQSDIVLGKSEARDGQAILDAHFPSGSGSPAYVVASQDKLDSVVKVLDADKGVASVYAVANGVESGSMPLGGAADTVLNKVKEQVKLQRYDQISAMHKQFAVQMAGVPQAQMDAAYIAAAAKLPSVDTIAKQAYPFKNATVKTVDGEVLLQVTLSDPGASLAARDSIVRLRDSVKKVDAGAIIGGTSASQYDTNQAALRDIRVVMPAILIAITLILMLLLRAIVAPLLLLLTTVLSFGATMGIAALVFNNLWKFPGADPAVIIFGFVFLVALGIDYNIFLMTRVREETIKHGVTEGTIKGLVVTGGVITSAGIVLAATFASLSVIPILFLAEIAFIVTFGVLLDTIIVRSLLVPALTLEIGRLMWWPSKLWRKSK
ncbi:MAG: MMPL family transporter [Candidatus Nomurabacteria bacterium]|nr:MAG: MMPL family transporter [Candidatus Nomurabacteria bacterium]